MTRYTFRVFLSVVLGCLLMSTSAGATEYAVGPNRAYQTPSDVPWESLQPGDTVLIYWRATPYADKWVLGRSGTAAQPIIVRGIPSAEGELPVIDGSGARTRRQLNYWGETRAIIKIGGSTVPADSKPSYIIIENLDIRGARTDNTFTDDVGTLARYDPNAAAVWIEKGEHIVLRRNRLHDSGNGLFVSSPDLAVSRNIVVEGNEIFDNGNVGSDLAHNVYTEAQNITFQFNHLGRLKTGANGNNLKDRSAGLIVRYNWIEGGNRQLDLVDSHHREILGLANYRETFVYGNVLVEEDGDGNRQIVMYGGDSGDRASYRKGVLYFYHNTVVSYRRDRTTLFFLPNNDHTADLRNNLFYAVAGGPTLSIAESAGRFGLSSNWLQPGFVTSFSKFTGSVTGATGSVVSSSPGFADELERDFSLSPGSSAQDRGGVLSPAAANHPVQLEYAAFASWTARPSDAAVDIGAFEVDSSEPGATPAPAPSLAILTTELPGATRNKGYTETIAAAGGLRPYTWVIAEGTLPPGLALDGATGVVSGRPTTLGRWGFVVQVQDTSGATSQRALEISVFR